MKELDMLEIALMDFVQQYRYYALIYCHMIYNSINLGNVFSSSLCRRVDMDDLVKICSLYTRHGISIPYEKETMSSLMV